MIEATTRNKRRLWLIGLFFLERKRDENFSSTQGRRYKKIAARYKGVGHYSNSITEVRKVSFALVSGFISDECPDLHGMKYDTNIRLEAMALPACTPFLV